VRSPLSTRTSARILLLGVIATLVASVLAIGQRSVDARTAGCSWNRVPTTPTPTPSSTVLDQTNFVDKDLDGVPDRWGSSTDYARDDCHRFTGLRGGDSLVKQVIHRTARNPNARTDEHADVSIQRIYHAAPGQIYTASADVDIGNYPWTGNEEDDFRGRLKLQPCTSIPCRINQLGIEYQANLCISEDQDHDTTAGTERCVEYDLQTRGWKTLTVTTDPLPVGTRYLLVAWRVREHQSDSAWGNGRLTRIVLYRNE
jgi:hypothetical protein